MNKKIMIGALTGATILSTVLATSAIGTTKTSSNIDTVVTDGVSTAHIKDMSYGVGSSSMVYEDSNGIDHVYTSGNNTVGQLGNGSYLSTNEFTQAKISANGESYGINGDVISIDQEGYTTAVMSTVEDEAVNSSVATGGSNHVYMWGQDLPSNTNIRFKASDAGLESSEYVSSDGYVYTNTTATQEELDAEMKTGDKALDGITYYSIDTLSEFMGRNDSTIFEIPVEVNLSGDGLYGSDNLQGLTISSSSTGSAYSNYDDESDRVYFWKDGNEIQQYTFENEDETIQKVATGKDFGVVWTKDLNGIDHLYGIGNNSGDLGTWTDDETNIIKDTNEIEIPSDANSIIDVVATDTTITVATDSTTDEYSHVYSMGNNGDTGLLGTGNDEVSYVSNGFEEVKFSPNSEDVINNEITDENGNYQIDSVVELEASKENVGVVANIDGLNHLFIWGNNRSNQLTNYAWDYNQDETSISELFSDLVSGEYGTYYSSTPVDIDTNLDGVWGTEDDILNFSVNDGVSVTYYDEQEGETETYIWGNRNQLITYHNEEEVDDEIAMNSNITLSVDSDEYKEIENALLKTSLTGMGDSATTLDLSNFENVTLSDFSNWTIGEVNGLLSWLTGGNKTIGDLIVRSPIGDHEIMINATIVNIGAYFVANKEHVIQSIQSINEEMINNYTDEINDVLENVDLTINDIIYFNPMTIESFATPHLAYIANDNGAAVYNQYGEQEQTLGDENAVDLYDDVEVIIEEYNDDEVIFTVDSGTGYVKPNDVVMFYDGQALETSVYEEDSRSNVDTEITFKAIKESNMDDTTKYSIGFNGDNGIKIGANEISIYDANGNEIDLSNNQGLEWWAIMLIVIGSLVIVGGAAGLGYYLYSKNSNKKENDSTQVEAK